MFPLGSVLFPGAPMHLRIFEPRYQQLLTDCLATDGTFGIVLIERGHEVGGGDSRFDVATLAHIDAHRGIGGGQHALAVTGTVRIRVRTWLEDDPYPRAQVSEWPDEIDSDPPTDTGLYRQCIAQLRRLLALAAELGHRVPPATFDVPDDVTAGSHLLAALAPLGPLDHQRLLSATGPRQRLALLYKLLDDQLTMLDAR